MLKEMKTCPTSHFGLRNKKDCDRNLGVWPLFLASKKLQKFTCEQLM